LVGFTERKEVMKDKITALLLVVILCITLFSACGDKKGEYEVTQSTTINLDGKNVTEITDDADGKTSIRKKNIKVKFEMEDGGIFVMELYPESAPETVANFCDLVYAGFYDGLIFHRVIPGFMAQGGDPLGTGMGGSEEKIKGEFASNGFGGNDLKHERGTVSMARAQDPDSASSQFFICFEEAPHLDGEYAAFGKVVYGMDTVDKMADAAVDQNDKPLVDIVIKKASVITDAEFKKYPAEE